VNLFTSRARLAVVAAAALLLAVLLYVVLGGPSAGPGPTPSPTAGTSAGETGAASAVSSAASAPSPASAAPASADESVPASNPSATDTPAPTAAPTAKPTQQPTPKPTPAPPPLGIQHVFLIVMENQDYTDVQGTSSTAYTTQLTETYAYANNYDAIEHPSLGNYLDMTGGTSAGTSGDCSPSNSCHVTSANLVDELEAKGITWKGYFEDMGTPCRLTDTSSGAYEAHHNPFAYFDSIRNDAPRCAAHTVDYSQLGADLASASTTPNFAFVVPSGPTHNGSHSISGGDTWLSQNVPAILSSPACTQQTCLVVLTWDEDNYQGRNQVLTVFAGSAAKRSYVSSVAYNHFSLLRTFESIFSVAPLTANDAGASPMTDMLK
jgi:phosphatidylinositol-3-phosphatase